MLYLNKLEGYKRAVKNLHWSSKTMPEHEYMDKLEELLSSHQDYVAEIAQGIFGRIEKNELKGINYKIKTPHKLLKDILKAAETFYGTIQKSKQFIGLRSVIEEFIGKVNQSTYLLDLSLIESVIDKNFKLLKENKNRITISENKLNQLIMKTLAELLIL